MDRILLGKNDSGVSGLWASKPGVNVTSYASNGYLAGTEEGPEGLYEGAVLPVYGYNENFSWVGANTYVYGFTPRINDDQTGKIFTTSNGTIRFIVNTSSLSSDPFFTQTLITPEQTFNGNNYPVFEIKIRRPKRESDDQHWQYSDFTGGTAGTVYQWFFSTSNAKHAFGFAESKKT